MNHLTRRLALFLLAGSSFLKAETTPPGGEALPSREQRGSYKENSFYAPKMTLSIFTLQSKTPRDAFVQLLEQPDKRVLTSLHWPAARHISALWNPDSTMVAINFQTDNKLEHTKIFRVSANGLTEIPLPKSLLMKKPAPPNSPLPDSNAAGENITPDRWKNAGELFCVVESPAKNPTPSGKHDEKTAKAEPVSYEVLLGLNGKEATVVSSKLMEKKR